MCPISCFPETSTEVQKETSVLNSNLNQALGEHNLSMARKLLKDRNQILKKIVTWLGNTPVK